MDTANHQIITATDMAMATKIELVVSQLQFFHRQAVVSYFQLGQLLKWMKENTDQVQYQQILNDKLYGMSSQAANRAVVFYIKCENMPRLKEFAEGNMEKAGILFNGLETEELRLIEAGEHKIQITDLDVMSPPELKKEIRKLREREKTLRDEERELYKTRLDDLQRRNQELEDDLAVATTDMTPEKAWFKTKSQEIHRTMAKVFDLLSVIIHQKQAPEMEPELRASIEGDLAATLRLAQDAHSRFISLFPLEF